MEKWRDMKEADWCNICGTDCPMCGTPQMPAAAVLACMRTVLIESHKSTFNRQDIMNMLYEILGVRGEKL